MLDGERSEGMSEPNHPSLGDIDIETCRLWDARSKEQLTGRLARSLMEAQDAALAELLQAQEEWDNLRLTAIEEEARQRKSFVRRLLKVLSAFVLSMAGAIAVLLFGPLTITLILFGCAAICLVWFGVFLVVTARHHIQWRHRLQLDTEELPKRRRHAISEFRRLSALYIQYLYWSEIISEALHRPLGSDGATGYEGAAQESCTEEETEVVRIRSLLVGEAAMSDRQRNLLELRVARNAAERGWMMRSFSARRRDWLEEYGLIDLAMSAQSSATPEEDAEGLPQIIYEIASSNAEDGLREIRHPLADFAKQYCSGLHGEKSRNEVWTELSDRLEKNASTEYIDHVETRIKRLEAVQLEGFLQGPLLARRRSGFDAGRFVDAIVTRDGLEHETWIGISDAVGLPEQDDGVSHAIRHPVDLSNEHPIFASFKLEVSSPILVEHCKLIAPAPDDVDAGKPKRPSRSRRTYG